MVTSPIKLPNVLHEFAIYKIKNPSWGSLHIVLEDYNIATKHVQFCLEYAAENRDYEGILLTRKLFQMTRTQRRKLSSEVEKYINKLPVLSGMPDATD